MRDLARARLHGGTVTQTSYAPQRSATPRSHASDAGRIGARRERASSSTVAERASTGSSVKAQPDPYRGAIESDILWAPPAVKFDDVVGLSKVKEALNEAVILPMRRSDIFQGLRAPTRGILLYGPPGNGKTMIAQATAAETAATFFAISASSLTSKWVGDSEKHVRALFEVARERSPSIIFLDEIDSVLGARGGASETEASRRLKTEFLVQFDGVATGSAQVLVLAATNRPEDLDEAVLRRLPTRVYIPLPDGPSRRKILQGLLRNAQLVEMTALYSGSDLKALCKEAAMAPIRKVGARIDRIDVSQLDPVRFGDFRAALATIRPSVSPEQLTRYEQFTERFGMTA